MKKNIMLIVTIFLVILVLIGTSYALLFNENETDKQSYTTGTLSITSESINNSVTLSNSIPMSDTEGANSTPYVFKITNTGNLTYKFNVMLLSTTTENQISSSYIKVKVNDNNIVTLNSLTNGVILEDITLKPGKDVSISLRVWLSDNTPNTEIGKTFNAKITTEGKAIYTESKALQTLTLLGLTSNGTKSSFANVATTDEGVFEAQDDLGTSYYFRGAVTNNYVYFAGFYWRIIRINGDGTIRMIYDGTSAHANGESSTDRYMGTTAYNTNYNDNAYVGYMYGTTGTSTYDATHANTNNSTIKTYLDSWYETNIEGTPYEQYVVDAIYCNDREIDTNAGSLNGYTGYTTLGYGTNKTVYAANARVGQNITNPSPTLLCAQDNDKFTVNSSLGNGDLTYPIGLITADEVVAGGGNINDSNNNYYLYTGNWFWTMSPYFFDGSIADSFDALNSGGLHYNYVYDLCGTRGVISLSSSAILYGIGTSTDPWRLTSVI